MFSFSSVKTLKLLRRILKSMAAAVAAMKLDLIAMAEMFLYRWVKGWSCLIVHDFFARVHAAASLEVYSPSVVLSYEAKILCCRSGDFVWVSCSDSNCLVRRSRQIPNFHLSWCSICDSASDPCSSQWERLFPFRSALVHMFALSSCGIRWLHPLFELSGLIYFGDCNRSGSYWEVRCFGIAQCRHIRMLVWLGVHLKANLFKCHMLNLSLKQHVTFPTHHMTIVRYHFPEWVDPQCTVNSAGGHRPFHAATLPLGCNGRRSWRWCQFSCSWTCVRKAQKTPKAKHRDLHFEYCSCFACEDATARSLCTSESTSMRICHLFWRRD